ncbi:MAG TPA: CoA transferase [Acidobacteriaceae bacterium]|jgi:crotonobetainyl-CoA:carnitine CoA-transferase CaiB-like acyl-CoA transferase|nr:CoA transferase [Acidobacteriaceae bacterium]
MQRVLDSIRVVEATEALAGPYCAMMLGDFGADVVKVERKKVGDQSRGWGPPFCGQESAYFLAANRNKRSLTLDYNHPSGKEIMHRLLETADVFLINQPSLESLKRSALDPESLCARFPRLIYCAITGYGVYGPKAGLAGYDIIAQAETGVMSFTGEPGGEPIRYPVALADLTCGIYSALGILAALFAREKTGCGQFLDMALFDSQLTLLANIGSNFLNAGILPQRWGNAHPSIVPYQLFRGADHRHFVVGVGTEPLWTRFTGVLGVEESVGRNPLFQSNKLRIKNRTALIYQLQEILSTRPAEEWVARLMEAQIPAALIKNVDEVFCDRQVLERKLIVEFEHSSLQAAKSIANPVRLSATPVSYRFPPPLLGEHNEELLANLGYSREQIDEASAVGAI